jgi:hypothetical protein
MLSKVRADALTMSKWCRSAAVPEYAWRGTRMPWVIDQLRLRDGARSVCEYSFRRSSIPTAGSVRQNAGR